MSSETLGLCLDADYGNTTNLPHSHCSVSYSVLEKSLQWCREIFVHYLQLKLLFISLPGVQRGWLTQLKGIWFLLPPILLSPHHFEERICFYCCFIHFIISCVWKASVFGRLLCLVLQLYCIPKYPLEGSLEVIPYSVDWPWKKGIYGKGSKSFYF